MRRPEHCPARKLDASLANGNSQNLVKKHRPAAIGEAMADGPGLYPLDAAGQCGSDGVPRDSESVLVVAMMPVMVMMPTHAGVGVHHLRIVLRRLDHRRLCRVGGHGGSLGRWGRGLGGGGCGK